MKINGLFFIHEAYEIAYERSNKWKKAEEDLQMAMNLKPNDPYVINYLAYSWLDRKMNIDVALNLLEKEDLRRIR